MPTRRKFSARVSTKELVELTSSIAAHLAYKLDAFGSDERTLTDELCDMFLIWAHSLSSGAPARSTGGAARGKLFDVDFTKLSTAEESQYGADLCFSIKSVNGTKAVAVQCKVFDPDDDKLRCDSTAGWDNLRCQLLKIRDSGIPGFFAAYVPCRKLDGQVYGFTTWEMGVTPLTQTTESSKFGVCLIPEEKLLDRSRKWVSDPPIQYCHPGLFLPAPMSFASLFVKLMTCRLGKWDLSYKPPWGASTSEVPSSPFVAPPRVQFGADLTRLDPAEFDELVSELRQIGSRMGLL